MSVRGALRAQGAASARLGSRFMARLLGLLADRLEPGGAVADRVLDWPGDPTARGDAVGLRLAGGLHALVLSGSDPALAAAFRGGDDAALWRAVAAALEAHAGPLMAALDHPPQTNEVRRSAVPRAVGQALAARFGLPLVSWELGASAGLNLVWDAHALEAGGRRWGPADAPVVLRPDWEGPLPPDAAVTVAARAGVDIHPLCPVADRLRALSYIWADQPERMALTAAALDVAAALRPEVARADAGDWLAARLAEPAEGRCRLVFHTIAWQYFPAATQDRCRAALRAAGAAATPRAPLAHLAMEADGSTEGALLTLQVWPGGGTARAIGRADFHGRWLRLAPDAFALD